MYGEGRPLEGVNFVSGVSVLIPVAGRLHLLERLLESVRLAQAWFTGPSEVLVLDNSGPGQQGQIASLATRYGAAYHHGSDNLSIKRNRGIELAHYPIILFLDSDCTVAPDLLTQHYLAYSDPRVSGCLGLLEFTGQDGFIWRAVQLTGVLSCFGLPTLQATTTWGPTANISFHREALLAVGGFDPEFYRPGGEDVDLGFRLQSRGATITCNPNARAFHSKETWSTFGQIARRFWAYGRADGTLIRKHPGRSVLDLPTLVHVLLMLCLFSIVAALATRNPALLSMPILWAFSAPLAYAGIRSRFEGRTPTVNMMAQRAVALVLLSVLDVGRLSSGLRRGQARAIYRRVVFFDEQQQLDWPDVAATALASLAGLGVVLPLGLLMAR